ncbi:DUF721 domain-containing protein [bacterium]|nr:DUF721 domain-containing protein [bacterium]NBX78643.1 DUF721 domain-containing protein [bacterium]
MKHSLQTLVSSYFQDTAHNNWKIQLILAWPTIIGNLADKVSIEKIKDHQLILRVQSASWMQELYCLSTMIIQKINNHLGKRVIHSVHFTLGTKVYKQKNTKQNSPFTEKTEPYSLSTREKKVLSLIKDQELSKALEQFLHRCVQK